MGRMGGMSVFEWQLLVVKEPIGEQCVVRRHCNLHRLNDTFQLFNTLEHFLDIGQGASIGVNLQMS